MPYSVYLKSSAEKELENLPEKVQEKIINQLLALKNDPRPRGLKKLHGQERYRIRMGAYRILYAINDSEQKIEIFSVAHRKEAYR